MPIIDSAVYVDGFRIENPASLDQTFEYMEAHGGMAWIGLLRPSSEELERVAAEFSLHPLAVEDALSGHQRSKLERYGGNLFAVLRPARYDDATETVDFGELAPEATPIRVRVTLPYENVRWTTLSVITPGDLTAQAFWQCLVDDPFTVNTTLPGWSP